MNHPEMLYILGSLGALLALFGGFLLFWRRYQSCAGGCTLNPRTRAAAWVMLIGGAALVLFAALFASPLPGVAP